MCGQIVIEVSVFPRRQALELAAYNRDVEISLGPREDNQTQQGSCPAWECLLQMQKTSLGQVCQDSEGPSLRQVPLFIIKPAFLEFLGSQTLITKGSKCQRKLLI